MIHALVIILPKFYNTFDFSENSKIAHECVYHRYKMITQIENSNVID